MPDTNQPYPLHQFTGHILAVWAIAALALALGAAHPDDPAPLALLPVAAMTRWIETTCGTDWRISAIVLDIALGLMTADIIALWA